MKNNLFNKFYFSTVLFFIIGIMLLMTSMSVILSNYFANEKKTLLVDNCLHISNIITNAQEEKNPFYSEGRTVELVSVLANTIDAQFYFSDVNGKVDFCSCHEWKTSKGCMHSAENIPNSLLEKVNSAKDNYFEISNFGGIYPDLYYTAGTVITDKNNNITGYIFASSSALGLQTMWNSLSKIFLISSALPIILLAASVYITTRQVTKPLKLMSEAAHSMSSGDFSKRIPVTGNDEIAELARSFNMMTNSFVQLESMQRNFITNVSHELRTPITTISGFIDGILDGTIKEEQQSHYLQIISSETKRLTRVVQSMLSLAKLESGEMKIELRECDMNEIIVNTLISQQQRIEDKKIEIEGLDGGRFAVKVDKDLMQQVIYNLVDNAVKFTPDNGKIEFVLSKDDNENSHIIIRNNGVGISRDEMQHVFEKFYKNDKVRSFNREGIGVGLYIVKTIMDIHNGKVTVNSEEGKYTEFELTLPNTFGGQNG